MLNFCGSRTTFFAVLTALCVSFVHAGHTGTSSWLPSSDLSLPGGNATGAAVNYDSNGHAFAVWSRFDGVEYIVQVSSSQFPGIWGTPLNLSTPGGDAFYPQVATDPQGNVVAVWAKKLNGTFVIQAATKQNNKNWTAPVNLSHTDQGFQNATHPQVIFDQQGSVYVIWQQIQNGKSVIASGLKEPGNSNWSAPAIVSHYAGSVAFNNTSPAITASPSGTVLVVWVNSATLTVEGTFKVNGNTWQNAAALSGSGGGYFHPQPALDQHGNAVVAWSRNNGQNYIIQAVTRNARTSWSHPVNLSLPGQDALKPSLSMACDGTALLAWQRSDGAYSIIQMATKNAIIPGILLAT